jgi:mRNA-degrading endonuclease toxin of MazEF toxin-antitoxin module
VAPPTIDRTPAGDRVTRFYAQNGQRFAVVLQPFAGDGQVRVAAIYLPSFR